MDTQLYIEHQRQLDEYLDRKRLRHTEERNRVLKAVCTFEEHFDANTLWELLKSDWFYVSRATVYNTLEVLTDAGIVVRHPTSGSTQPYELRCIAETHAHVICLQCGKVRELRNKAIEIDLSKARINRFTPKFHSLYIYGICTKCKQAEQAKSAKKK